MLLRRHWWTNVSWILTALILAGLPIIFENFSQVFTFINLLSSDLKVLLLTVWYFLVGLFVLENFLIWYYNVFLVTNERVLDLDFYGLFHTESSEATLPQIQDVSSSRGGLAALFFNYGNVFVQTAAEEGKIEILGVPEPDKVHKIIIDLKDGQEPAL